MTLEEFGFTSWFRKQLDPSVNDESKIARVIAIHKGGCDISNGQTTHSAKTTGDLRRQARAGKDYLTVGDWVLVQDFDHEPFVMIHSILERQNALKRKVPGRRVSWQLIATNIDTAFVVHTLDKGFNLRKLERYLSIINDSEIKPIILLTKKDLLSSHDWKMRLAEVKERLVNMPVFAISNTTGSGFRKVRSLFNPGNTYCLLGASGVGKTSLINRLIGKEDQYFTLPVREKDGKGIHSTTWRELIVLNNGALIIDTPGMRELGHLDHSAGVNETFEEITALAGQCKFRDCTHSNTQGCAVIAAVESGSILQKRYDHFIRMRQESRTNERALRQQRWKNK